MNTIFARQPLPRLDQWALACAANDATFTDPIVPRKPQASLACNGNVRLLRRAKEQDRTRFVMSGKLSDVCAALDALAALEQRQAWRYAGA